LIWHLNKTIAKAMASSLAGKVGNLQASWMPLLSPNQFSPTFEAFSRHVYVQYLPRGKQVQQEVCTWQRATN